MSPHEFQKAGVRVIRAIAVALVLLVPGAVLGNSFFEMPGEFRVPVPDGWAVSGEATSLPVVLVHDQLDARMSIFRTELTGADQMHSEEAFQASVSGVIDSVVLQLPEAVLLTSTGYNEKRRAVFVVEFTSVEPDTNEPLEHYLVGILYRHPDGYQIMYSMWGKASRAAYAAVKPDFEEMRQGFNYTGPAEDDVFGGGGNSNRWLLLALGLMIALLFWIRRRRTVAIKTTTGTVPIWRCTCGRANHIDNEVCRRCGAPRPERIT